MLKISAAALLILAPIAVQAREFKAPVSAADRAAYAHMSGEQAYNWLAKLTARTCPGVHVASPYSREAAIAGLSTAFATFDRVVAGVEKVCKESAAKKNLRQAAQ